MVQKEHLSGAKDPPAVKIEFQNSKNASPGQGGKQARKTAHRCDRCGLDRTGSP
jgi:hypothetical protein